MGRRIELQEEEPLPLPEGLVPAQVLDVLEAELVSQIQTGWLPQGGGRYLRARGYIGQAVLANGWQIVVHPKVEVRRLVEWMEWGGALEEWDLLAQTVDCRGLGEVFECLLGLLADRMLRRARDGLFCGYLEEEQAVSYVRGRIRPGAGEECTLRWRCRYAVQTPDIAENRIPAWTLNVWSRFPFSRPEVGHKVRRARAALAPVQVLPITPQECVLARYHRLNLDYRPLHLLCRFLLEAAGPDLGGEGFRSPPFWLFMPALFEAGVAAWLLTGLRRRGYRGERQVKASLEGEDGLSFRIDLVIWDAKGNIRAVLDTKYKRQTLPDERDIQQVVAYAVRMGVSRAVLVYPSAQMRKLALKIGQVEVRTAVFAMDRPMDLAGEDLLREIGPYISGT